MKKRQADETEATSAPTKGEKKAKHKPEVIKWHISTVPEAEGEESEFVGSLALADDPESFIEEKDRIEPGTLCRIVKGNTKGKIITSYRYRKLGDGRIVGLDMADDEDDGPPAPQSAPVMPVSELGSIIRESAREAVKALQPQAGAASPFSQVDEIEARVDRILERRDQERTKLLEEVRAEVARQNPPSNRADVTPAESDLLTATVAKLAENDPTLAQKIAEHMFPEKESGFLATIGQTLAQSVLSNPQATNALVGGGLSIVQSVVGSIFKRPPVESAAQSIAAPVETAAPAMPPEPFEQPDPTLALLEPMRPLIEAITAELVNNEDYDRTRAAITQAVEREPQLTFGLAAIAQMSSVEVLNTLARFTRQPILLKLRHGAEWIEGLQSELRGETDDEADEDTTPAPVASNNGTKAHAGAAGQG